MKVRVGIVDSGVNDRAWPVVASEDFTGAGTIEDSPGHGTAVAARIMSAGIDIELYVARVFDRQLSCSTTTCAAALDWLQAHNPHFVNMSFGLRRDDEALRASCERSLQAVTCLVAASPAQGGPVFPSAYPGIIRATGDARCRPGEVAYLNSAQADFGGYVGDPATGPAGASIGCASVTARLIELRHRHPAKPAADLAALLAEQAEYQGVEVRA